VRIPSDSGRPVRDGGRDAGRGPRRDGPGRDRPRRSGGGDTTRLYIGLGRTAGVRPGDLVGAITGEAGLSGRDIGAIEIAQRFSLVEVPAPSADDVMAALRASTIKGRRPTVRLDRGFDT
jgi:ATP-dependent RNA helicase DeaD